MSRAFRLSRSAFAAALILSTFAGSASAQVAGTVTGGVTGNVAGTVNGGVQGNVAGIAGGGGILIDAEGVVKPAFSTDKAEQLAKKKLEAAALKLLPADVNKHNPQRKVSLVRLEAACAELAKQGKNVDVAMTYLAGLQRIDYVFVYPEEKDVVLVGPAEGFAANSIGRVVGMSTGRPPIRLDDLMVALRSIERAPTVGCSIDPVQANLAAFQRYVNQNNGVSGSRAETAARYKEMARILGNQDVRVFGVPPETHFAQVLVEADYRMKLLSVGLESVSVNGFRSHLSMTPLRGNSMQRWWMSPLYEPFQVSADRNAFQFAGQRVQLLAQEEVTDAAGNRAEAAFTKRSTSKWAQLFTEKYDEIAEESPVLAELQNLFDLSILAALIRRERLAQKAGWSMAHFLDAEKGTVATGRAPRQVPSVSNYRATGRGAVVGLVGGGVVMSPSLALADTSFKSEETGRLGNQRASSGNRTPPAEHPWWWD